MSDYGYAVEVYVHDETDLGKLCRALRVLLGEKVNGVVQGGFEVSYEGCFDEDRDCVDPYFAVLVLDLPDNEDYANRVKQAVEDAGFGVAEFCRMYSSPE